MAYIYLPILSLLGIALLIPSIRLLLFVEDFV